MNTDKTYKPSKKIIDNYARVMIDFALGNGRGVKCGETVYLAGHEVARDLFVACRDRIYERGGNVICEYLLDDDDRRSRGNPAFFKHANDSQIEHVPKQYYKGLYEEIDHMIYIESETNLENLSKSNPEKVMKRQKSIGEFVMPIRQAKENAGELSWTLCLYPTQAYAEEAGMSLREYWREVIRACQLDRSDPIGEWKSLYKQLEKHRKALNKITEQTLQFHVQGADADLWITPGAERQWLRSTGQNIPSFEIFTSPDWRGTNGWIQFNQPLYFNGSIIKGVQLWFEDGVVAKSTASKNKKILQEMIATTNGDKVGEFSLTDKRYSRITRFMANTLYDENVGGPYGNTHIALGFSYQDTWTGDLTKMTPERAEKLGYNVSAVHTDIMSTTDRVVTAHLKNGKTKVIYKDGLYQV